MTIIGLDDTDSRVKGMCTTYAATRVAERVEAAGGTVDERLLVRLNPAVERKTRGNAALAIHTDLPAERAFDLATRVIADLTVVGDRTSSGVVVADCEPDTVPEPVVQYSRAALREIHDRADALALADECNWLHAPVGAGEPRGDHAGYGRIGALAAIGAADAFDEWTYEHLAYREFHRCGTEREVDEKSVFAAADSGYPVVWDTIDKAEGEAVCVPNAPGPILYGIRGDDPDACRSVAAAIDSEPIDRAATFRTNQGTDAHVEPGEIGTLRDDAGYAVDGVVSIAPETREGGHTFFELVHPDDAPDERTRTVQCVAFEPTKRFRDRVRRFRVGDEVTVVGEHDDGTIKLEKFAVRDLVTAELTTPTCESCGRTMKSAGRNQGYRCRDCDTAAPGRVRTPIERELEIGWYEVPPCARRHVAKPLVRGGFDAPIHPER